MISQTSQISQLSKKQMSDGPVDDNRAKELTVCSKGIRRGEGKGSTTGSSMANLTLCDKKEGFEKAAEVNNEIISMVGIHPAYDVFMAWKTERDRKHKLAKLYFREENAFYYLQYLSEPEQMRSGEMPREKREMAESYKRKLLSNDCPFFRKYRNFLDIMDYNDR